MSRRKNSVAEDEEKEYNQKKEKNYDFAGVKAAAEMGAKAAGSSAGKSVSAGISAIASLVTSGAETATKAAASATKKTNSTQQKPKEVTKTDAEKMMDYLYDEKNLPKTEDFLFNNGFPSREDREYNKEFFGEQEEKKQTVDLFKAKTNSVLNPTLPNSFDRDFRKGLMGDEEEERDYNKQVEDNKKAKSDYAFAFRGSPFEHLFAEPQTPPAGMPLKKQDPIAELMAKAEQYSSKKEPTMWFENGDYAASQSKNIDPRLRYEFHPAPENMNKTPTESNKTQDSFADSIVDSYSTTSNIIKDISKVAETDEMQDLLIGHGAPLVGVNQAIAKGIPIFKKTGKAFGIASGIYTTGDVLFSGYKDYKDDNKINDLNTYKKAGSALGGWALSSASAALGAKAFAALGTAICPGAGTIVGGVLGALGGLGFGLIGDYYGKKHGGNIGEKIGEAIISDEEDEYGTVLTPPRNYKKTLGVM